MSQDVLFPIHNPPKTPCTIEFWKSHLLYRHKHYQLDNAGSRTGKSAKRNLTAGGNELVVLMGSLARLCWFRLDIHAEAFRIDGFGKLDGMNSEFQSEWGWNVRLLSLEFFQFKWIWRLRCRSRWGQRSYLVPVLGYSHMPWSLFFPSRENEMSFLLVVFVHCLYRPLHSLSCFALLSSHSGSSHVVAFEASDPFYLVHNSHAIESPLGIDV